MIYQKFFKQQIENLRNEGRYRVFVDLERSCGEAPYAYWHCNGQKKKVVVWCTNDYLGMSQHPKVVDTFVKTGKEFGVGSGGTRNIAGTSNTHVLLEQTVANWHKKESALVFGSGYIANEATLSTIGSLLPGCVLFSDEHNHASMIQGIRHSKAERFVFKHNDLQDLESKLKSVSLDTPKIIACVSVYSMNGDFAPIADFCDLAKKYNALLFVDEVHAVGLYGPGGAGVCAELGLSDHVDIIQGNFAKAVGVVGGYIASNHHLIDFVRSFASGFIFTTSIPPAVAMAAVESINVLKEADDLRKQFRERVNLFIHELSKTDIPFDQAPSHIIPIIIGDAFLCKQLSQILLEDYGIYVQPINYPTVPRGQERLRVTITPFHTKEHIHHFIDSLNRALPLIKKQAAA